MKPGQAKLYPGPIAAAYRKVLRERRFLFLALAFGLSLGGSMLYIGSAANYVVGILHPASAGNRSGVLEKTAVLIRPSS